MRNTRRIPALLPVLTLVVLICGCGTSEVEGFTSNEYLFAERSRRAKPQRPHYSTMSCPRRLAILFL